MWCHFINLLVIFCKQTTNHTYFLRYNNRSSSQLSLIVIAESSLVHCRYHVSFNFYLLLLYRCHSSENLIFDDLFWSTHFFLKRSHNRCYCYLSLHLSSFAYLSLGALQALVVLFFGLAPSPSLPLTSFSCEHKAEKADVQLHTHTSCYCLYTTLCLLYIPNLLIAIMTPDMIP